MHANMCVHDGNLFSKLPHVATVYSGLQVKQHISTKNLNRADLLPFCGPILYSIRALCHNVG